VNTKATRTAAADLRTLLKGQNYGKRLKEMSEEDLQRVGEQVQLVLNHNPIGQTTKKQAAEEVALLPGIYQAVGKLQMKLRRCKFGSPLFKDTEAQLNKLELKGQTIVSEARLALLER